MQAKIYQTPKSPIQSGQAAKKWLLELYNPAKIQISFDEAKEAIDFAQKEGINYELIAPRKESFVKKNYADNFR